MNANVVDRLLAGADTRVEIEAWANEKLDGLPRYLKLEYDTFGRIEVHHG